MLHRWLFRSLPVHCFSVNTEPVNVPGWLNRHHPGDPGSRQRKSPLRGIFAPSLGLTPTGPAQALFKIAPGNFVLSLFLQAFGSGTSLHPCRLCPLGASLRLAPAFRKRFGDFQPDQGAAVRHLLF
ncbi:hypothetical protein FR773_01505 [Leclercia adecarboxylata]|nr:hypothetical protein FR773_01505 [Leclercia adecarboxylata]